MHLTQFCVVRPRSLRLFCASDSMKRFQDFCQLRSAVACFFSQEKKRFISIWEREHIKKKNLPKKDRHPRRVPVFVALLLISYISITVSFIPALFSPLFRRAASHMAIGQTRQRPNAYEKNMFPNKIDPDFRVRLFFIF